MHQRADALTRRAADCLAQGDLTAAEKLQSQAVGLLRKSEARPELAAALNLLGIIYWRSGNLQKAESVLHNSVRTFEQTADGSGTGIVNAVQHLGAVLSSQGKYTKAERAFDRALSLWRDCCRGESLLLAHIFNNRAAMYSAMGRHDEATEDYKRALAGMERTLGPNHIACANTLNNLAQSHAAQRDFRGAVELYERAATIWRNSGDGTARADFASLLGNYGVTLAELRRYEEAEQLYRESVAVLAACCGERHPDYVRRLNDHAHILRKLNRKDEASAVAGRAAVVQKGRPDVPVSSLIVDVESLRRNR